MSSVVLLYAHHKKSQWDVILKDWILGKCVTFVVSPVINESLLQILDELQSVPQQSQQNEGKKIQHT